MNHFCALLSVLDESGGQGEIQEAVNRYIAGVPDEDLLWAVFLLRGGRLKRQCTQAVLKQWCVEAAGIPLWLVEECTAVSRDTAEAVALIIPPSEQQPDQQLSRVMSRLNTLAASGTDQKYDVVVDTWKELHPFHRILFNRLLTGRSVVHVPAPVIHRALAIRAGQREEIIAFRLGPEWHPLTADLQTLLYHHADTDSRRFAHPFHPIVVLDAEPEDLGDPLSWAADIVRGPDRVQLIKRGGDVVVWSDGGEWSEEWAREGLLCVALPDGTVLECSVSPERTLTAYDILEFNGEDVRARPLEERNVLLDFVLRGTARDILAVPRRVAFSDWGALRTVRAGIRERDTHILLRRSGGDAGAQSDPWRLWKPGPLTIDAVLLSVKKSDGGVALPYSEMTLAVRTGDRLVPCARVHPSLPGQELEELVSFVENNTTERFGPVRSVSPLLVFTLGFDAVWKSNRRKSGFALANPRIICWNRAGQPADAATLDQLRALATADSWKPRT